MKLVVYTDGGSRGNPGPAGVGVVICHPRGDHPKGGNESGVPFKKYSEYLGEKTNNEAEYEAVILALKKVKALYGKEKIKGLEIEVRSDSELIVKQLNHQYRVEEPSLQPLFMKVWNMLIDFGEIKFCHVPREQNRGADKLVNECLDGQSRPKSLPGF
ncbi:MAG: ribonuclease HI family protein [Candidatus Portnoybacteria bacterium]|nr:ribonuclease HI family protein [Candidatus Portnoybacteria bacterium]